MDDNVDDRKNERSSCISTMTPRTKKSKLQMENPQTSLQLFYNLKFFFCGNEVVRIQWTMMIVEHGKQIWTLLTTFFKDSRVALKLDQTDQNLS